MSNQSKKLANAIQELHNASAMMKSVADANPQPTKKKSKKAKARARARARTSGSPSVGILTGAAASYARVRTQSAPVMMMSKGGEICVVKHREYVSELTGASSWTTSSFTVNPGLPQLFEWLSQVASRFEKYRFRRLRFCYETESPTSQAGSVVLAIDYNAGDAAPVTKQQAMAYKSSVRCAPWQPVCLEADLRADARDVALRYVRNGSVPSGQDVKTYDLATFFLGTQNSASAQGELYVDYEIELHTPTIMPALASAISNSTGNTAALPLGTPSSIVSVGNAPVLAGGNGTNSVLTFQTVGYWAVAWAITGTVLTGTSLHNDASTVTILLNQGAPNSAATQAYGQTIVQSTSPGQQLIFDYASTTISAVGFEVYQTNQAAA